MEELKPSKEDLHAAAEKALQLDEWWGHTSVTLVDTFWFLNESDLTAGSLDADGDTSCWLLLLVAEVLHG